MIKTKDKLKEAMADQISGFFYASTGVSMTAVICLLAAHVLSLSLKKIPEAIWSGLVYLTLTLLLGLFAAVVWGEVKSPAAVPAGSAGTADWKKDFQTDKWIKFFASLAATGLCWLALGLLEPSVLEMYIGKWQIYLLYSLSTVFCAEFLILTRSCRGYVFVTGWNDTALSKDEYYIPRLLEHLHNTMNGDEILCERICHELYTYTGRARFYKRSYYLASAVTIAFPAIVVVLNNQEGDQKLATSILSAAVTIVAGLMGTIKLRESWIRNRVSCEHVKSVLFQYMMKSGTYRDDSEHIKDVSTPEEKQKIRTKLLVEDLENIFQTEYGEWKRMREQQKE